MDSILKEHRLFNTLGIQLLMLVNSSLKKSCKRKTCMKLRYIEKYIQTIVIKNQENVKNKYTNTHQDCSGHYEVNLRGGDREMAPVRAHWEENEISSLRKVGLLLCSYPPRVGKGGFCKTRLRWRRPRWLL